MPIRNFLAFGRLIIASLEGPHLPPKAIAVIKKPFRATGERSMLG